jgi:hypothetical protein
MNLTRIIDLKERIATSDAFKPDERDFLLECIVTAVSEERASAGFDRKGFRHKVGGAMIAIQNDEMARGMPVTVVLPEMIAALMSLAAHIAKGNAHLSKADFQRCAREAAKEQWE